MKKLLSLLSILLLNLTLYGQIEEELRNQKVDFESTTIENTQHIISTIYSFVGDDFDSLDIQLLLSSELIAMLMIDKTKENDSITFGDVYNKMLELKQKPDFSTYKEQTIIVFEFLQKPADYDNWEKDKQFLEDMGLDSRMIDSIGEYIKEKNNPNLTYNDVLNEFSDIYEYQEVTKEEPHEILERFYDIELFDEERLLQQSKLENKPILLYFTGHNVVNCKKFEMNVLFQDEVADVIMENFIFVPLYIDDRTALPEGIKKSVKDPNGSIRHLKTIGERNSYYQYSRFENSAQPYFAVINAENEVIKTADFNYRTITKFVSFLEEALDKSQK